jgi:hypothetical protein
VILSRPPESSAQSCLPRCFGARSRPQRCTTVSFILLYPAYHGGTPVNDPSLKALGLSLALHHRCIRDVRPIDCGPADVLSSTRKREPHIRIPSEGTGGAEELSSRFAIGLVDMPTAWARSAGVAWIDKAHRHAKTGSLIDDKRLQLCKGPRLQYRALRLSSPHPRLDMRQIFQRYPSICAFRRLDQSLGYHWLTSRAKPVSCPDRRLSRRLADNVPFR